MSVLEPDYDADPGRRRAWTAPQDVHDSVGPELSGPVLDVACGEGRLAALLRPDVEWVGVDPSRSQLAECARRPVAGADMRALPFRDECFAEVAQLWCLYHLADPVVAIAEAKRVLRQGGRYYACTRARDDDPEHMREGYPPGTFDAEEALAVVSEVFPRRRNGGMDSSSHFKHAKTFGTTAATTTYRSNEPSPRSRRSG